MPRIDERLRLDIERAARPADPAAVFDRLEERLRRRASLRRVRAAALAGIVLAATITGFVALSRSFSAPPGGAAVSPFPIVPHANGRLAYTDGSGLYTIALEGGDASRIGDVPEGVWHVAWSPDGSRLAIGVFPDGGPRELWVANADGSNARLLAQAGNVSEPAWSPDGNSIVFAAEEEGGSSIHVIAADGEEDRVVGEVLRGPDYFSAAFSPDGTEILFDRGTDAGFAIYVMRADGTDLRRLTEGTRDYDPAWSPDGRWIAFSRQEDTRESDIFVMRSDGTGVRRVTDDPFEATNLGPVWAPDGTLIAYQSGRSGGPGGLVVVEPDGSHPRTLVEDGVLEISWQPLPTSAQPTSALSPRTSPSPNPEPQGRDIGLGFDLCDLERLEGIDWFGDGTQGAAWIGTGVDGDGRCGREATDSVLAADLDGDGSADVWTGIDECIQCAPWAATDLDGNGTEELVVMLLADLEPTFAFYFAVPDGLPRGSGIYPIFLVGPGAPAAGLPAGEVVTVRAGAGEDGLSAYAIRCEGYPEDPVLVVANWVVDEGTGAVEYHGARLKLEAADDLEQAAFVVVGSFTPTATSEDFGGDGKACGVDFNPWN